MKSPFGKRDIVICIDDYGYEKYIRKGNKYTVKESWGRGEVVIWQGEKWIAVNSLVSLSLVPDVVKESRQVFWKASRFRLYNPPPQEKTTTDNKAKVKA